MLSRRQRRTVIFKYIKPAKNKLASYCLMWFHEFFKTTFSTSVSAKWINRVSFKLVWSINFREFFDLIFGGFFVTWLNVGTVHLALRLDDVILKACFMYSGPEEKRGYLYSPPPHILADTLTLLKSGLGEIMLTTLVLAPTRMFRPSHGPVCSQLSFLEKT